MLRDPLLMELDHECATTRRLLERIPDDALDWKPHEKSFSLQELATHLVNIPTWVDTTINADGLDMAQDLPTPPTGGRDVLVQQFDENVTKARKILAGADDADLLRLWALSSGHEEHFRLPKVAVLRTFVFNHLIHHRGQLSVYLRMRDVPLPSIYGPSADEALF